MKKTKLSNIALLQALGLLIYCALVAKFMWYMGNSGMPMPELSGAIFMLFLLAFSVTVCGLIVFGYPIYLAINKKFKDVWKRIDTIIGDLLRVLPNEINFIIVSDHGMGPLEDGQEGG